ncbi:hypothetical protein ACOMHN_004575 [Nucella lapillus]
MTGGARVFVGLVVGMACMRCATAEEEHHQLDGCKGGVITSTNFPNHYPPNAHHTWTITVDPGFQVRLEVKDFCIESSRFNCSHDSVRILYGDHLHDRPYCGDYIPPTPFISTGRQLSVVFKTNQNVTGRGFNATYGPGKATYGPASIVVQWGEASPYSTTERGVRGLNPVQGQAFPIH